MKKVFALAVVALAAAAAVTATLSSAAPGGKKATINIGVFLASSANTYWAAELQGAKRSWRRSTEREVDGLRREVHHEHAGEPAS